MAERAWHEQGLRDAALAGDAVAWRTLIDTHADAVRRYLAWRLGGPVDYLDDLAQEWKETPKRYELYVREYGLLLTSRDLAPPDAITVQELWKQTLIEKAASEAKKAKEKTVSPK